MFHKNQLILELCDFISKKKSTRLDKNYSDISKRG